MDLQFGQYLLKRAERQLLGPKGPLELSARSFDILALLLERPDEVIGKTELFDAVWPGLVVEENTLQVHMSALRKTLDAGMITTVHGRGYKYSGPRPVAVPTGPGPGNPASLTASNGQHPMLDMTGGKRVPVTGGCLCGEIRYRVTGPVLDTNFCSCRMCQKWSGAPFTAGSTYPASAVQFTKGEPKYYKSSPFAERGFCVNCGSSLTYRPLVPPVTPDWANWILIYTPSLDNPAPNAPTWHLGIESQLPWADIRDARKRVRCQDSPDLVEAWAAFNLPVP
ncbi:MAG TPA: winged helix-turn-helix domain-containing protein [Aestuariivirga sp.]|nr:winged helix-turn-helix domain-containing protein [Aestuariivirga sp.]